MIAELRETSGLLADILENQSSVPILEIDDQQRILSCNAGFMKLFALQVSPVGVAVADFLTAENEGVAFTAGDRGVQCNPKTGVHGAMIVHCVPHKSGLILWCERLLHTNNQVVEQMTRLNNEFIAMQRELAKKNVQLKRIHSELEHKVAELEGALFQIKRLEGIIPICMYCKKVRDDEESWHQLEKYISEHTEAEFSHGICPACFDERYS